MAERLHLCTEPTLFHRHKRNTRRDRTIQGARVLVKLGDSITTDHISPAGAIKADTPAGRYLIDNGVKPLDFNSYGSRRGNHEVMMRGTFANIRLRKPACAGHRRRPGPYISRPGNR